MFAVQSQCLDDILITVFQENRSRLKCSIVNLPQDVCQGHDTKKRKQVQAEDQPATAIQPVTQRTPHRSIPEESSRQVSVCPEENNHRRHFNKEVDLRARRDPPVDICSLFVLV